nr:hypothetical protein [Robbsia andropogonis]
MSVDASPTPSAATSGHATGTVASSHPVTGGDATGQATAARHAPVRDWLIPDVALRQWNTFGFDVRARFGATVDSADALWAVLRDPRVAGLPVHVLGGGQQHRADWRPRCAGHPHRPARAVDCIRFDCHRGRACRECGVGAPA